MKKGKRFRLLMLETWESVSGFGFCIGLLALLLFFRLGSLVPAYSLAETSQLSGSHTINGIVSNPINAPYKLLQWVLMIISHNNVFLTRSVAALVGLLAVLLFYYIVSRWTHSTVLAILGSALLGTSSWFLHYARLATPDIFLTLILATLAYGTWIRKTQRPLAVIIFGALILASLAYLPGLIWFVVVGGIWQRKAIGEHLKQVKLTLLPVIIFVFLLFVPLAIAFAREPALLKAWLGLPNTMPSPYDLARHIVNVPFQIYFRGPDSPTFWLGRLPLLDAFTAAMSLMGAYAYFLRRKLDRAKILAGTLILGTVLVGLRGGVSSVILLPFIYLLAVVGISYLSQIWFSVFPHNPLARIIAVVLIGSAVTLACLYNIKHYFVAWPNTPATKQTFSRRSS